MGHERRLARSRTRSVLSCPMPHASCLMPHAPCLTHPCRKSRTRDPPSHTCALPSQRLDWRSKEIDMTSNDVIALDGVSKTYRLGRIRVRALEDVTPTIGMGT